MQVDQAQINRFEPRPKIGPAGLRPRVERRSEADNSERRQPRGGYPGRQPSRPEPDNGELNRYA